jgi:hypothetical protein
MSRLVEPTRPSRGFLRQQTSRSEYAERVAKYIPGEILSAYLAVNGILAQVAQGPDPLRILVHFAVFVFLLGLTPIYFRLIARPGEPTKTQIVMSMLAFVVWVYNLGGPFAAVYPTYVSAPIHMPWLGAILLIIFTVVSGLVAPQEGT